MLSRIILISGLWVSLLVGCAVMAPPIVEPTVVPPAKIMATTPSVSDVCTENGTYHHEQIVYSSNEDPIRFHYYLPPCYDQNPDIHYPVLYLLHGAGGNEYTWNSGERVEQIVNPLIQSERIPPLIIVLPRNIDDDRDGDLFIEHLIPYIDANFRTRPERQYRVVGGASYGGMMSMRMAFKYPQLFSRAGDFGHGVSRKDAERMDLWLDDIPLEERPQVLIDIGYRDPAMKYGEWLIELLESRHVPYLLLREVGRHDYQYWSGHMPFYLEWFATDW
jgi:enterochelin esterase-like enzyme